jgi:uncharacterized repeat protein (TIGR03943 family)
MPRRPAQARPALRLSDVVDGVRTRANRDFLASHDVILTGFVAQPGAFGPGTFVLTRFLLTCCAADAVPIQLEIVGARSVPAPNRWVTVTARLVTRPPLAHGTAPDVPLLRAVVLRHIHAPSGPYESLR